MLDRLGPGLWTVSAPLRLAGAEFGTRMTVVQIGESGLALIAPIEIDDALARALAEKGQVEALIAPNAFHHLYFLAAAKRYPEATCFLAEGVEKKLATRPAVAKDLAGEPDPLFKAELEQVVLEGAPLTNEVIFFHGASKTLILTDLCFNFDPAPSGWTGLFLRLAGAHGRLAVSRLMRAGFKDRDKVRATIARVLEWDFEKVIVTHGTNIEGVGRDRFRQAVSEVGLLEARSGR
jgi:hypothetical protein